MNTDGKFTPEEALDILEMRIKDLSLLEDDPKIEAAFILTLRNVVMENNGLVKDRENNNRAMNIFKHVIDIMNEEYKTNVVDMDRFLDEAHARVEKEKTEVREYKLLPPIKRDEDE